MFKNRIKKFIVIALCTILALPFFTVANKIISVNADSYDYSETVFISSYHTYEINNDNILNSNISDVVITAKTNGKEDLTIYSEGKKANTTSDNRWCEGSYSKSDNKAKVSIIARVLGDVEIVVSVDNTSYTHTAKLTVVDDSSYLAIDYLYDATQINNYNKLIEDEIKDKSFGDFFTVPSFENLINSSVDYNRITKNVYYAKPGADTYSTVSGTKTSPSFSLSTVGTYRFYSEFYIEKAEYNAIGFSLTKKYLVEKQDGFYAVYKKGTTEKLYAVLRDGVYYYYESDELLTEDLYEGEVEYSSSPIIPIFTFELDYVGPIVEILSNYEKEGYIGLQHRVDYVSVDGMDITTTYTLLYSSDNGTTWVEAEEELDSSNLSFTPQKKGVYKVKVQVVDAIGYTASGETASIVVSQKYFVVDHVSSFSDWLSVNTLPFILLCISATCLLAIIALLVIKPKEKSIDDGGEDR